MRVQKHFFVPERNVIKDTKTKNTRLFIHKIIVYIKLRLNDHVRYVGNSPGIWSSMFEDVFLQCKNSSWAIIYGG